MTANPDFLLVRPATMDDAPPGEHPSGSCDADDARVDATWPPPDPLGEALHFLRMDGAFYCRSELSAPWGMTLQPMPGCLWFHVVTAGAVLARCRRRAQPVAASRGRRARAPGHGHVLRSEPGVPAPPIMELDHEHPSDRYEILRHGRAARRRR